MDRGAWWATIPWGHKESDMTERLTHTHIYTHTHKEILGDIAIPFSLFEVAWYLSKSHVFI